jgi:hypothetical protein
MLWTASPPPSTLFAQAERRDRERKYDRRSCWQFSAWSRHHSGAQRTRGVACVRPYGPRCRYILQSDRWANAGMDRQCEAECRSDFQRVGSDDVRLHRGDAGHRPENGRAALSARVGNPGAARQAPLRSRIVCAQPQPGRHLPEARKIAIIRLKFSVHPGNPV